MAGRRGVGAFRLFGLGAGWLWTLLLLVPVLAVIGYGLWTSDPTRNPAPAGYRAAACETYEGLAEAVDTLDAAVAVADVEGPEAAVDEAEAALDAAVTAIGPIANAPDWAPGVTLTDLLRAVFGSVEYAATTLITGAPPVGGRLPIPEFVARPDDPTATAASARDVAQEQLGAAREAFAEERYGFSCPSG